MMAHFKWYLDPLSLIIWKKEEEKKTLSELDHHSGMRSAVTAMFYHFLAPEGGHPTWEEHFIRKLFFYLFYFFIYLYNIYRG